MILCLREGVPFLLGDWWERGSGPPQSQDNVAGPRTSGLRPVRGWGTSLGVGDGADREYPAEIIVPLVGGYGDAAGRSQIETAT